MSVERFEKTLGTDEELITKKFEKWAKECGNKSFIFYGEENKTYTYHDFNKMANNFAHHLMKRGIQKGDRISLFLKNPLVTTIAMFGIWKAGAVFCPINFNYKGKLLSYQINDTKPKLLVTERQMVSIINGIKSELYSFPIVMYDPAETSHDYSAEEAAIELDSQFPAISFHEVVQGNYENPNLPIHYYDTANIIYTSGTTGAAKGVVQSYRWIHGYTYFFRAFNKQEDVIYNDLPMYHVGGAFALVARAAFAGCTVALWDKFSPHDFWERIRKSGATNAILLDVMIPWLMKAPPSEKDRFNTLNRVHMQPLPQYHNDVAKRFGINFVSAGYGQTESGNGFVGIIDELGEEKGTPKEMYKGYTREETQKIAKELEIPFQRGNEPLAKGYMGYAAPFYEAAILDEHDNECGIGQPGQIAFRSKFPHLLLKEYFNKPAATVEVFQNLWFHTGDVGYRDENGIYYFVDRMKDVIRHKGENISSYQVEDMINQHSLVSVSAAFPIPAEEGDEDDIVVFVVPKTEKLSVAKLEEWTKREMPKFMWPKHIHFIKDLPRTPTNKIEKYKLKKLFLEEFLKKN
ncbi:acyl-CoA synthetase [Pueribacillus theae]|uniref:Acyl-CoA synthetase n=1 Tax=Pueribacillus theae TaxID=2171751 RepID=A0A2U1K318_9BACI|nr:AMP-binding protein [Pueribacillus theae]PWA11812.1 acyl-CoA synthetase [Pueribacillus theae]